jgi:hypothetical protein
MKKNYKLPREGVAERRDDGLNVDGSETDTEAHRYKSGDGVTRLPGTGGDAFPRRPSSGGELTEDDVEGHGMPGDGITSLPGTGGDAFPRRPSSGGELTDDDSEERLRQ